MLDYCGYDSFGCLIITDLY